MSTTFTINPDSVELFYWQHLDDLDVYTRFHFLTRLFFLANHVKASKELQKIYHEHLEYRSPNDQWNFLDDFLTNPKKIADPERAKLLEKFPELRQYARYFFIILFAKNIWNLDLSNFLVSRVDEKNVSEVSAILIENSDDLLKLSTFALNFMILGSYFYTSQSETTTLLSNLYEVWDKAWLKKLNNQYNSLSYNQLVYFVTHVLINDSLFYTRKIPTIHKELHLKRLKRIEDWLLGNFDKLSIDCLCELVVAFEMLSVRPTFKEDLYFHLLNNVSSKGKYLTEPDIPNKTVAEAEHTNVLFILGYKYLQ